MNANSLHLVFVLGLAVIQAWSLPRDEKQSVEWARYLLKIEADTSQATQVLQRVLVSGQDAHAISMAHALMGELELEQGKSNLATDHLRLALSDAHLSKQERAKLLNRLLRLDPASIPSLSSLPATSSPVTSVKSLLSSGEMQSLLMMTDSKSGQTQFALQKSDGSLKLLAWGLKPNQQLLDATENSYVVFDSDLKKLSIRNQQGSILQDASLGGKPEAVHLVNSQGDAVAWLEGSRLRLLRNSGTISEFLVEAPCTLHRDGERTGSALLLCGDQSLYRADFSLGQVKQLGRLAEKPLNMLVSGDNLLLQYADHFEIRHGPRFDAFSWGYPSLLQDRIILSSHLLLLINPKGGLQAFDLHSGQPLWKRELLAQEIYAIPDGLLALTMAHTLIALDEKGNTQWTYSIGWSGDPLLQASEKEIVLFYPDARRVHIHREGARAAQKPGNILLQSLLTQTETQPDERLLRLQKFLEIEPGNGDAWRHRYTLDKQKNADAKQLTFDLMQVARSSTIPAWSNHPVLKALASQISAIWTFKREYGPRFYPNLITGHDLAFYVESDNQTLVILDPVHGTLVNSYRFAEDLDLKAAFWRNDTLCVSSATRIYLVSPWRRSGLLAQLPLKAPLCQALSLSQGILTSDWQGNIRLLNMANGQAYWERKLGIGGSLLGKPPGHGPELVDIIDLDGHYYCLQIDEGLVVSQMELGQGNPIESHSLSQGVAIGLAQGQVLMVNRQTGKMIWQCDIHEPIFNLTGNRSETLVLTTSNKRVICLRALDGTVLSDQHLAAYLFNRPLVLSSSYWIGTTDPSLEQRDFTGQRIATHPLTDMPGSPTLFKENLLVGTLDHLIFAFSNTGPAN